MERDMLESAQPHRVWIGGNPRVSGREEPRRLCYEC